MTKSLEDLHADVLDDSLAKAAAEIRKRAKGNAVTLIVVGAIVSQGDESIGALIFGNGSFTARDMLMLASEVAVYATDICEEVDGKPEGQVVSGYQERGPEFPRGDH